MRSYTSCISASPGPASALPLPLWPLIIGCCNLDSYTLGRCIPSRPDRETPSVVAHRQGIGKVAPWTDAVRHMSRPHYDYLIRSREQRPTGRLALGSGSGQVARELLAELNISTSTEGRSK